MKYYDGQDIPVEKIEILVDSAFRQLVRGVAFDKVIEHLEVRGIMSDDARSIAEKAKEKYLKEKRYLVKTDDDITAEMPTIERDFNALLRGFLSWIIAIISGGHIINPSVFKKRPPKRVQ